MSFTWTTNEIATQTLTIYESNITLNKAVFGFDEKYADITKLYTFPYSMLEVTDDEGNYFTAKIENSGTMKIHQEVSLNLFLYSF